MFDYLGVGVLVLLAALFGWLVTRAWGAQQAWLKWLGAGVAGTLTLISGAILVIALIGFYRLNAKQPNAAADIRVAGTPEQVARGAQLAQICAGCHGGGQLPLTGQNALSEGAPPIGTLYVPNLTMAGEMKDWTDGEIIRAIREGVHQDGRSLLIMPSAVFRNMSDADAHALVAYLRSTTAGEASPPTRLNLLGALFIGAGLFPLSAQPPLESAVAAPPAGVTKEYGAYLVSIAACTECHGPDLAGQPEVPNGPPGGPNLTTLVPQWTEAQFLAFFNTGQTPAGATMSESMPWKEVRGFASDDDLRAMYLYLSALPPQAGPSE